MPAPFFEAAPALANQDSGYGSSSGSNSNLDLGFQRGLNLGKKYLQGSVKTSTLNQVMANIYLPYSQSEMFEIVVSILVFILLTFNY